MSKALMKKLIKNSNNKSTVVLSQSDIFTGVEHVRTRIPILNLILSGLLRGGLMSGLTLFAGPSKHFKSNLGLLTVASYMKQYPDSICMFYDSEKGVTKSYLKSMGVDPDRVVYTRVRTVEQLRNDVVKQLDLLDKEQKETGEQQRVIFFIDSVGNTASKKETQDALEDNEKQDMTRAKAVKSMFRIVTPYLGELSIPMVAICHTYDTQETYSKKVISGGTGLMYSADTAIIIGKKQVKEGTEIVGWDFVLNAEKSRFVKEKIKFDLHVTYDGGISPYSGLLQLAQDVGYVVKPKNGWYSFGLLNEETGEIVPDEKAWRESATNSPAFWQNLLKHEPFHQAVQEYVKLPELELTEDIDLFGEFDEEDEEELDHVLAVVAGDGDIDESELDHVMAE